MKLRDFLKEAWTRASNSKMSFSDLTKGRTDAWHYDPRKRRRLTIMNAPFQNPTSKFSARRSWACASHHHAERAQALQVGIRGWRLADEELSRLAHIVCDENIVGIFLLAARVPEQCLQQHRGRPRKHAPRCAASMAPGRPLLAIRKFSRQSAAEIRATPL
jgi:hypothetical protein